MKHDISLMRNLIENKFTKRSRFTRQCIGEAMISLMQTKEFEEITISDIVKKAGVSRMTFYHYFQSKTDAVNNYLHEIIETYLEECSRTIGIDSFYDVVHIRHAFLFFDQYADFFLTLAQANLYSLILNAIDEYILKCIEPIYPRSPYELHFYKGALLNVFLEWEAGGKQESVDELVEVICHCCNVTIESS